MDIVTQKKETAISLIKGWMEKSGVDFKYSLPEIKEDTAWFLLRGEYNGWEITLDINLTGNRIDTYGCNAKKDGYKSLKYEDMTVKKMLTAKPIDKEFEGRKAWLKARVEYAQKIYDIAQKYGVIIHE